LNTEKMHPNKATHWSMLPLALTETVQVLFRMIENPIWPYGSQQELLTLLLIHSASNLEEVVNPILVTNEDVSGESFILQVWQRRRLSETCRRPNADALGCHFPDAWLQQSDHTHQLHTATQVHEKGRSVTDSIFKLLNPYGAQFHSEF
jgi:hypothetical protein